MIVVCQKSTKNKYCNTNISQYIFLIVINCFVKSRELKHSFRWSEQEVPVLFTGAIIVYVYAIIFCFFKKYFS